MHVQILQCMWLRCICLNDGNQWLIYFFEDFILLMISFTFNKKNYDRFLEPLWILLSFLLYIYLFIYLFNIELFNAIDWFNHSFVISIDRMFEILYVDVCNANYASNCLFSLLKYVIILVQVCFYPTFNQIMYASWCVN